MKFERAKSKQKQKARSKHKRKLIEIPLHNYSFCCSQSGDIVLANNTWLNSLPFGKSSNIISMLDVKKMWSELTSTICKRRGWSAILKVTYRVDEGKDNKAKIICSLNRRIMIYSAKSCATESDDWRFPNANLERFFAYWHFVNEKSRPEGRESSFQITRRETRTASDRNSESSATGNSRVDTATSRPRGICWNWIMN
jgi:hypothetical protein